MMKLTCAIFALALMLMLPMAASAGELSDVISRQPQGTIEISSAVTVNRDTLIPSGVTLKGTDGGMINIAEAVVLTVQGGFEAPLVQVFAGPGRVAFEQGARVKVQPHWWGVSGSGSEADPYIFSGLQQAIEACQGRGHVLELPSGRIFVQRTLMITQPLTLKGQGRQNTHLHYTAADGSALIHIKGGHDPELNWVDIMEMHLVGSDPSNYSLVGLATGPAISYENLDHSRFEYLDIDHFNAGAAQGTSAGIRIAEGYNNVFRYIRMYRTTIGFDLTDVPDVYLDGDLLHFEDVLHNAHDNQYAISFRIKGVYTRSTVDGKNIFTHVKYGVYWDDPDQTTTVLYGWRFSNLHFEGNEKYMGQTAFHIKIGAKGGGRLSFVTFDNCHINGRWFTGYDLEGVEFVNIIGGGSSQREDKTFIKAAPGVRPIVLENVFYIPTVKMDIAEQQAMAVRSAAGTGSLALYDGSANAYYDFRSAIGEALVRLPLTEQVEFDPRRANTFLIEARNTGTGRIMAPKPAPSEGHRITVIIKNSTGQAMEPLAWAGGFSFAGGRPPALPASGQTMSVSFVFTGEQWMEVGRAEGVAGR